MAASMAVEQALENVLKSLITFRLMFSQMSQNVTKVARIKMIKNTAKVLMQ